MVGQGATILTPFVSVLPEAQRKGTIPNVGDGFILDAIVRLLAPVEATWIRSNRIPLTDADIERINQSQCVILAGANQLYDDFSIVPGMTPELFERIRVPVVPVGVGWRGEKELTQKMSPATVRLLQMMHERIPHSSWRCAQTVRYLLANVPELKNKALMTGCPVQYQPPLMNGTAFTTPAKSIVVTVTERGNFWEREAAIVRFVAREFPNARRTLALHQDYTHVQTRWKVRHLWNRPKHATELHALASELGYQRLASEAPADFYAAYRDVDGHFGTRLHAHLYLMGQGRASYLVAVDDRSTGIAESSDFPLYNPDGFPGYQNYNFTRYQNRMKELWPTMDTFLAGLRALAS